MPGAAKKGVGLKIFGHRLFQIITTGCPRKIVPRLPEDCEKTAKDYH